MRGQVTIYVLAGLILLLLTLSLLMIVRQGGEDLVPESTTIEREQYTGCIGERTERMLTDLPLQETGKGIGYEGKQVPLLVDEGDGPSEPVAVDLDRLEEELRSETEVCHVGADHEQITIQSLNGRYRIASSIELLVGDGTERVEYGHELSFTPLEEAIAALVATHDQERPAALPLSAYKEAAVERGLSIDITYVNATTVVVHVAKDDMAAEYAVRCAPIDAEAERPRYHEPMHIGELERYFREEAP